MKTLYSIGKSARELGITVSALRHLASKIDGLSSYEVITPSIKMQAFTTDDLSKMQAELNKSKGGERQDG
jgi:hypothetical protein